MRAFTVHRDVVRTALTRSPQRHPPLGRRGWTRRWVVHATVLTDGLHAAQHRHVGGRAQMLRVVSWFHEAVYPSSPPG